MPEQSLEYTMQCETRGGVAGQDSTSVKLLCPAREREPSVRVLQRMVAGQLSLFTEILTSRWIPSLYSGGNWGWTSLVACPRSHKSFHDLPPTLSYVIPQLVSHVSSSPVKRSHVSSLSVLCYFTSLVFAHVSPYLECFSCFSRACEQLILRDPTQAFCPCGKPCWPVATPQQSLSLIKKELFTLSSGAPVLCLHNC